MSKWSIFSLATRDVMYLMPTIQVTFKSRWSSFSMPSLIFIVFRYCWNCSLVTMHELFDAGKTTMNHILLWCDALHSDFYSTWLAGTSYTQVKGYWNGEHLTFISTVTYSQLKMLTEEVMNNSKQWMIDCC